MREYLKIKVTSLGTEIRQIRDEEQKAKKVAEKLSEPAAKLTYYKKKLNRIKAGKNYDKAPPYTQMKYIQHLEKQIKVWERRSAAYIKNPKLNERRYDNPFWGLRGHRLELSQMVRSSNIAYGFLRGKKYSEIEKISYTTPNWKEIERLVNKYNKNVSNIRPFNVWKTEAEIHFGTVNKQKEAA